MKRCVLILILFLTVLFAGPAVPDVCSQQAAATKVPLQYFTLNDNSVIKGYLVGITNGVYAVQTQTMGVVNIPAANINTIAQQPATAAGTTEKPALPQTNGTQSLESLINPGQMQAMQQQLLTNPKTFSLLQDMLKDPEIMDLMQNKELMQDLMSMDVQKIQNNPDFQKLMQNPKMNEIFKAFNVTPPSP